MVAYSSTYCLPCLEGTDSPCLNTGTTCDPSTVWCDLVNLVEAQLIGIDSVLSRTFTGIPLASVTATNTTGNEAFPTQVVWDTVEYDTDGMVNLDVSPLTVTPRRSGVYMTFGLINSINPTVTSEGFEHKVFIQDGSTVHTHATPEITAVTDFPMYSTTQQIYPWTLGVSAPFSLAFEVAEIPLFFARMTVYWVCDL